MSVQPISTIPRGTAMPCGQSAKPFTTSAFWAIFITPLMSSISTGGTGRMRPIQSAVFETETGVEDVSIEFLGGGLSEITQFGMATKSTRSAKNEDQTESIRVIYSSD